MLDGTGVLGRIGVLGRARGAGEDSLQGAGIGSSAGTGSGECCDRLGVLGMGSGVLGTGSLVLRTRQGAEAGARGAP